ncbi:NAD(P)/FAD-dependent oxidoreductase [Ostreibacterium oceani]|uniref:NAD(P)-binding protein n=1 Tax=Ostreibacterium oceani TaxID=2654998 RepID=A0A6N7EV73_9GAMM|nr:FAD-dependent oxidoreductase [Ostreibacterium oceani]MPV85430.1 NAD(P)-binding protein [Ostreibacterium oceani]
MKIAVIGTGISGMAVSYLLHPQHDITVYEQSDYIGGHSRTRTVQHDGQTIAVDTGFIVFNARNYPHLCALFKHLDIPTASSNMSFGVSIDNGWLEYGTNQLLGLLAQKKNLCRPKFYRLLADILRFNRQAKRYVEKNPQASMAQCLTDLRLSNWFRDYYLLAMGGAIWSTPSTEMLAFPAKTLIQFFDNHGLLTVNDQPQWHTVLGGSQTYIKKLTASFSHRIRLNTGVKRVKRLPDGVAVIDCLDQTEHYDQVIFACHSDQALAMIAQPTAAETSVLGRIRYQPNQAVLHTDARLMPHHQSAWSSWVYLSRSQTNPQTNLQPTSPTHPANGVSLTYWMNNLQPLGTAKPLFVTLNPAEPPDARLIYDTHTFHHPLFDADAIAAQQALASIQGTDKLWFCGAWQRYGFHEDGLLSAVNLARQFGVTPPWEAL